MRSVAMRGNIVELREQLDQTRDAHAANDAAVAALEAAKAQASATREGFAEWKDNHDALAAEGERLGIVIGTLEVELASADEADAQAEFRKRYAEKVVANEELAARIRSEVAKANAILIPLA